ncbi:MAG: metallophosphoesterase [Pseudomonadota bacterium]|nr:metallophosphoesterase [Pseudomonadota bacterium]
MTFFSKMFESISGRRTIAGPDGYRAYAVGDVHGRIDLLDQLLSMIEADIAARGDCEKVIVFLGDLIDRGPASAAVVERLRTYQLAGTTMIFLSGNHEEVMLRVLAGERGLLADWLQFGGAQCLKSYGIDHALLPDMAESAALDLIAAQIPKAHQTFLEGFADTFRFGDYLFVHAGIRPGLDVAAQAPSDLRWIRGPFLDDSNDHGFMVVHGHTITTAVDERSNRIGLDTGAYRTGILTALAVEGTDRWFLDTASA